MHNKMCSTGQPYLWNTKCAVVGCTSTALRHRLFRFPRQKERYREWADFSQNPTLKSGINEKAYICLKHFSKNQFRADEPKLLIYNATPTYLSLDNTEAQENESFLSDDDNNSMQEDEDTSVDPQINHPGNSQNSNNNIDYVTIDDDDDDDNDDDEVVILEDPDVTIIKSVQKKRLPSLIQNEESMTKYRELRRVRKKLKRLTKKQVTSLNIWPKETIKPFIQVTYDVGVQAYVHPELQNIALQTPSLDNNQTPLSEQTLPTIVKDIHQQMSAQPEISCVRPPTNFTTVQTLPVVSSISSGTTQCQTKTSPISRLSGNSINHVDNQLVNVQNNSSIHIQSNPLPVQQTSSSISTITNSLDKSNIQKQSLEIHVQPSTSTKTFSDPQQVQRKLNVEPLQRKLNVEPLQRKLNVEPLQRKLNVEPLQRKLNVEPLQVLTEKAFGSSQVTETHTHSELPPTVKFKTSTKLNGSPKSGNFLTTIASILTSSQTNSEKENSLIMDVRTESKDQRKTNIQQTQNHILKTVDSTVTTSQNDFVQENPTIMNGKFETYHKQQDTKLLTSPTNLKAQSNICNFFKPLIVDEQSLKKLSAVTHVKSNLNFVKSTVTSRDKNIQLNNNDQQLVTDHTETITPSKSYSQETSEDIYCIASEGKSHISSIDVDKATVPLLKKNTPCTRSIFINAMDTVVQSMSSLKNSVTSFGHTTKPCLQSKVVDVQSPKKPRHQSTCVNPTVMKTQFSTRSHHKSMYVDSTVVDSESSTKPCHPSTLVTPTVLDGKCVNSVKQFKKKIFEKQLVPFIKDCFVDLSSCNNGLKKTQTHKHAQPTFNHSFTLGSHNVKSQGVHLTDINPTASDDKPVKFCKNLQSGISPTVFYHQNELSNFVNPPAPCGKRTTLLQENLPTAFVSLQTLDTQNESSKNQQCTDLQPDLSTQSVVARKHAMYNNKRLLMYVERLNSEKNLSGTVTTSEGTLMMPQIKPIIQSKLENATIYNGKNMSEKLSNHVLEEPPPGRLHKQSGTVVETHNGSSVNKKQRVDNLESKDKDNYLGIVIEPDIHSPLFKRRGTTFQSLFKKRRLTNVSKQRKQNVIREISKKSDPLRISKRASTSYIKSHRRKSTVSNVWSISPQQHFPQNEVLNKPVRKQIDPSFTLDVRQHFNKMKFKNNKCKDKSSRTEFEHCLKSTLSLPFSINSKATNDILDKSFNPKNIEVEFQPAITNCTPSFEKSMTSQVENLTDSNFSPTLKSPKNQNVNTSAIHLRSNDHHNSLLTGFPLKFTKTIDTNNESFSVYKQNRIKTYVNTRRISKTNCEEQDTSKSPVFKRSKLNFEDKFSNHEHDSNDTTVLEKYNQPSQSIEIFDNFDVNIINPSKRIEIINLEEDSDNIETEESQLLSTNQLVKSISETSFSKVPVVPTVVQQILNSDCEEKSVINYYTNLQPMVLFDRSVTSFEEAVNKYIRSMENSVSNHTEIPRQQNHQVYINYGEQNLRMMGVSSKELMEQDPAKPWIIQLESAWST